MSKYEPIIDATKCIGCGLCVSDCVAGNIKIVKETQEGTEKSAAKNLGVYCIGCGHCEAICPSKAVTVSGYEEEPIEYEEAVTVDPETLMDHIRMRRSIRQFKDQEVPQEIIDKIIEAGRLAPTAVNAQNNHFIVLGSRQKALEKFVVTLFQKLIKAGRVVIPFLKNLELGDNYFFKGAPLVIVIAGGSVNGGIAAENMAFMAEANGLGVLYSGYYTACANTFPQLKKRMGMKLNEKVVTTLVMGYPAVKYRRSARRNKANLTSL